LLLREAAKRHTDIQTPGKTQPPNNI